MSEAFVAVVTGALGLVGAAAVRSLSAMGMEVIGIDNDMRAEFFGDAASNMPNLASLERECPSFRHLNQDIRDFDAVEALFLEHGAKIAVVVHAAAQPSHDWAASHPFVDWSVNATATLNMLEACRRHAPEARFLFLSTNKVYGDHPNHLPLVDAGTRLEPESDHPYFAHGIDETMSIDRCKHSLFGVSKAAADLMVQEYAQRFGLATTVFRAGCLTGEDHNGAKAHGFLAYLAATARSGGTYEVIGHSGRQVRDNLHASDVARAFQHVIAAPPSAGVYNLGGGRKASVSVAEALSISERLLGRRIPVVHNDTARFGDHAWWITDTRAFQADHPGWQPQYSSEELLSLLLKV